ncbi:MAG: peptidylprolyl isomerase [Gracilimonas sp.]|nr:peptidylprolyl isomerase [Gracilimonas sp.]
MKFNNECVKYMCNLLWLVPLLLFVSCEKESAYSKLLTEEYSVLYEHIYERNADSLLNFVDHPNEYIRTQAWRSLINTPISDIDELITKVQYSNSREAWMALSNQELSDRHLSRLHDLWIERGSLRNGISLVLGKQGNQNSLNIMVQHFDEIIGEDSDYEDDAALAISRLMMDHEINSVTQKSLLRYAAILDDEDLYKAYFYGLYRGNKVVEDEELQDNIWNAYTWVESPEIRQYVLRMSFNNAPTKTLAKLSTSDISEMNVQLAVELAQHTNKVDWNRKLEEVYSLLLEHENPVVNNTALEQITAHSNNSNSFDEVIIQEIVNNNDKEATVRLSGIQALTDPGEYLSLADSLAEGNSYLLIKKFQIQQKLLEPAEYLELMVGYADSENRLEALFAAQSLQSWWSGLESSDKTAALEQDLKKLLFALLNRQDRSITYTAVSFMEDAGVMNETDFTWIEDLLGNYKMPEDIEVFQAFGGFFKEHFEEQAASLITEWSGWGSTALNNTLSQQGWNVDSVAVSKPEFRKPDWERLGALGFEPVWVLETDKGQIKIIMDVLSAPVTIAGMDSLITTGAYDNVPFHRVVPNFVIQGGDVESQDGFGGPDYVVPTEGSEKEYDRGVVGIASAGTDTEGSQFFIMHQWSPHLNGNYTVIGEVLEGMDVVDRITVGDKVTESYWLSTEN